MFLHILKRLWRVSMRRVFLFPGYGAQHKGMLDDFPDRVDFVRLTEAASAYTRKDIAKIAHEGPVSEIANYQVAYPLLTIANSVWSSLLNFEGVEEHLLIGYGVGDIAALAHSRIITIGAAVSLSAHYAEISNRLMANSDGAEYVVIGLEREAIEEIIGQREGVWISADNSISSQLISGVESAIEALKPELLEAGARKVSKLPGIGAPNSPLMAGVQDEMRKLFKTVELNDPLRPVLSCYDNEIHETKESIVEAFINGITSTINFRTALIKCVEELGIDTAIESGPGSLLSGYAMRIEGLVSVPVTQYAGPDGFDALHKRLNAISTPPIG